MTVVLTGDRCLEALPESKLLWWLLSDQARYHLGQSMVVSLYQTQSSMPEHSVIMSVSEFMAVKQSVITTVNILIHGC